MRIAIDIRSLIFSKAGVKQYTKNIIESLVRIDKTNDYTLFCNAVSRQDWTGYNIREEVIRLPHFGFVSEKLWKEILLPGKLISRKIDLFHSPRFILPKKKPCKFIVTMHDVAFKKFPQLIAKKAFKHFNGEIKSAVNQADRIIAVSCNTKKDLIDLFGAREDKIEVIYEGINAEYRPVTAQALLRKIKNKYELPEKFILFVGTIEPRKNLKRLIEAFYGLKRKKSIEHSMVIAGGKGWHCEDAFETVEKLKLKQDVIFTGHISQIDLPLVYNLSDLFIYPSLYEGFGFPPLEAMACGIPVIGSNVSSLPEVLGEAAMLVDPYNVRDITEAIGRVLEDDKLKEKMVTKGFERAKVFSWQNAAKKTLKVYTELCGI